MAEPAHSLDDTEQNRIYDMPGNASSDPRSQLGALEDGDETRNSKQRGLYDTDKNSSVPSKNDLSNAEQDPGGNSTEGDPSDNSFYKQPGQHSLYQKSGSSSLRGYITRRRAIFGGGIIGAIIALIILLISSGPLQFIHLSQVLQRNFFHTEKTVQIRNKGLFRYARSGNVEETRLGSLGSKVYSRTLSQLKEQGIEFQRTNGKPDSMTIDTSKNDNYRGLSSDEQRAGIIRDYQINDEAILSRSGSVYKINLDRTTLKGIDFVKATTKTAIGSLGNGKIETGLSFRYLREAWKLPSIFHPLRKLSGVIKERVVAGLTTKQAYDEEEKARLAAEESAVADSPTIEPAKTQLKKAIDTSQSLLTKTLLATAGMCAIRAAANAAVTVNRGVIVLPATVQAADKIAIGSQVQSGQDFDLAQLGAVSDSFTNAKGQTIWQAKALQATEGLGSISGPDIPSKYAQAFSGTTTADNIRNYIQIKDPVFHTDITSVACSKVGQVLQFVGAAILLVINIPDGESGSFAVWAAEQAATAAAFGGIVYGIVHFGTQLLSGEAVPGVLSGPVGGNLLAYGAREMSNVGARSMGGVAIDGTENSVLSEADQKLYNQQFNSEPVAKRLFDMNDSRSVISKFVDHINPNLQNLAVSLGSIFTDFGNMFTHSFAVLSPHAAAASAQYDWGFPKYGIPDSLSQDPRFEDPYNNADYVAKNLLDSGAKDGHDMSYTDKALACFGADINKDSGMWSVIATQDVNPDSDEYKAGHCNDSDDNWRRLMLFVMDSRLMDAIACHQGTDEQSCTSLDAETSANSLTAPASGGTTVSQPSAALQQLAQQILANPYISYPLDATSPNGSTRQVLQAVASGRPAPVTCQDGSSQGISNADLNPNILQAILDMAQGKTRIGVNALTDKCHSIGSNHYKGLAVDFECQGVQFDVSRNDVIAAKFGGHRNSETCGSNYHWHYDFLTRP